MSVTLAAKLPEGDHNGLAAIAADLVDNPTGRFVVVAVVDCVKVTTKVDTGDAVPTARILRIEAIRDGEDGRRLNALLLREFERRTGKTVLPFDLEEELSSFGQDPGQDS